MKLRVPFYYNDFHCITDRCNDNCCVGGWEIDIDEETYDYYQSLSGELGETIRNSIVTSEDGEHMFKLNNGHCPLLLDSGLCKVHAELGEEHLGVVCSQFPRYSEYFGEYKESGIGLACEEAARIVLSANEKFSLVESELDEEVVEDSEFDKEYADIIFAARDIIFKILEKKELLIHERLACILELSDKMQDLINEDDYEGLNDLISNYDQSDVETTLMSINREYEDGRFDSLSETEGIRSIIYAYEDMEVLNDEWERDIKDVVFKFHEALTIEEYYTYNSRFFALIQERMDEYKNLLQYFVFRYFAKAIYDHDVLSKAKMLITNFFVIKEMDMAKWIDKGWNFTHEDQLDVIHVFSRQVEYSEENMEVLYEAFIFDEIFEKDNLMGLLWIDSVSI
ncbi:flagellin lysine-N-methylase [Lachnospira pectinoschiza]|uniref:Lysine-N-methylase n=1 Tax=Lachnospira pectinoschiza TaxID=28052 RepID=A0A1G9UBT8_9FIRM|nr:flagellin lysine-N-methylase [Lachnospira pectinoschiza]SDM57332.1 lysine-N-methylase [Lachnospira pectinoschiza]